MRTVQVVLPDGIDDPARPSGGNVYDRQVCHGLAAMGWSVREHPVPGDWPRPDAAARACLAGMLAGLADGAVVLLDGLIASSVPEVLVPEADRLRLVVLMHMPVDDASERAVVLAAAAVITTSGWTRRWLLERYPLEPGGVRVAEPGVAPAGLAQGTAAGAELLCVGALTPGKGHDVLLGALAMLDEPRPRCMCVGSLTRDPAYVCGLRWHLRAAGIGDRVCFSGPKVGTELDAAYAAADVLVLASRAETYGMVVAEALARGIPVIATRVGGVSEALGRGADGNRPGLLVPPGDPAALAAALRRWLGDAELRRELRRTARERRATLAGWPDTADRIARVLAGVAAE
ncbi:MAG: glycosyltransferase family 4 protein [Jatrophihabitantaceae bacterium]